MSSAPFQAFALTSFGFLLLLLAPLAQATPDQWVTSEQLRERVVRLVQSELQSSEREIAEVKPPPLSAVQIPEGAALSIKIAGEVRNHTLPVEITVVRGEEVLRRQRSFIKVEYFVTAWALKETMAPQAELQADQLVEIKKASSQVPRDAVLDPAQLEGSVLRRRVEAGVLIRSSWITAPTLVKRGSQIDIIFKKNGIFLIARGEALGDGKRSDMIRVRNLKSKKIVTGRVIGINEVSVGD